MGLDPRAVLLYVALKFENKHDTNDTQPIVYLIKAKVWLTGKAQTAIICTIDDNEGRSHCFLLFVIVMSLGNNHLVSLAMPF